MKHMILQHVKNFHFAKHRYAEGRVKIFTQWYLLFVIDFDVLLRLTVNFNSSIIITHVQICNRNF